MMGPVWFAHRPMEMVRREYSARCRERAVASTEIRHPATLFADRRGVLPSQPQLSAEADGRRRTNTLSIDIRDDLGLSFVLIVDGHPLGDLVSTLAESLIPYWLVEDGLPTLPPFWQAGVEPDVRIVAVCSCGEYGCGHTRCRVCSENDEVIFEDFENDVSDVGRTGRFVFERARYEEVVGELVTRARERKALDQAGR